MATRSISLNREKTFFLLSAAGLVAVVLLAVSRPSYDPPGLHRTKFGVPGEVDISAGRIADANPTGRNPFTRYVVPGRDFPRPPRPDQTPVNPTPAPIPLPPKPPDLPNTVKPVEPKRYEVPVNFTGVYGPPEGGDLYVLLKDKRTSERRRLVKGDMWPEINLRIVEINWTSVLLENDKGERFMMRDLLGRRSGGEEPGSTPTPKP